MKRINLVSTALCVLLIVLFLAEGLANPEEITYSSPDAHFLDSTLDDWIVQEQSAIDIEYMTIGEGKILYSFAVLTDLQGREDKLQAAVDEVIALNNDPDPDNDIEFVIVLGDLIHGVTQDFFATKDEAGYRHEYNLIKTELERLEKPCPEGAGIHYIPLVGNHDVWCLYDMYSHNNTFPDYPEALFAARDDEGEGGYFGSQYDELSQALRGWIGQPPPVPNPYQGDHPDKIYFQNFAFDYGPYHFICLDFCARDDFDPVELGVPPGLRKFWGCADLHENVSQGTYEWLETHLDYCEKEGIADVIILSHHPVIYQLEALEDSVKIKVPYPYYLPFALPTDIKGELHIVSDPSGWFTSAVTLSNCRSGTNFEKWGNQRLHDNIEVDRVEGDAAFAFNNAIYDCQDEYDSLVSLFSCHDITIVHWFSGHYHLKGFNWIDPHIDANMSVIPSIVPAEDIYGISFTGEVRINDLESAVITPAENPRGCFTVVTVRGLDTHPDADTDSQEPQAEDSDADGVADDEDQCYNPGCSIIDETGCPVDSDGDTVPDCEDECPEEAGTKKGCPEAGISGFLVVFGVIVAWKLTKFK